jgi:hypothetical protein
MWSTLCLRNSHRNGFTMLNEIQNADDPDQKWPKDQLLSAIGIPLKPKNVLCNSYWKDEGFVSPRMIFELAVSEREAPRPDCIMSDLIYLRTIGPKTFWHVIECLNNTDMGQKCNAEWKHRHQRLTAAKRIVTYSDPTCFRSMALVLTAGKQHQNS